MIINLGFDFKKKKILIKYWKLINSTWNKLVNLILQYLSVGLYEKIINLNLR